MAFSQEQTASIIAGIIAGATSRTLVERRIIQAQARQEKAADQQALEAATIAALIEHRDTLPEEAGAITAEVGQVVTFRTGRGETARQETGKVVAVAVDDETNKVTRYKVITKEGTFDAAFVVVFPAQLESVQPQA